MRSLDWPFTYRSEERSQLLPRLPIERKIGVDNFAGWPFKCCWYCNMIGGYGSHDGCREALHGSCVLLQPSQSLYFSFVQIKVHFSDVTEDFQCRTLKIATWFSVKVLYQNKKPYSPPGHSRRPWWTGVDGLHWTGLWAGGLRSRQDILHVFVFPVRFFRVGINLPAWQPREMNEWH